VNRPYRHFSDTDLFKLADDLDKMLDAGTDSDSYFMARLADVEAEIAEREFD
jgi:hypothetical protein